MTTAPHTRHNWTLAHGMKRSPAYRCRRCHAIVPVSLVAKADAAGASKGLPLETVLDLLYAQHRVAAH